MCRYNSIVSASAPTYHERLEDKYTSKFSSLSPCTLYLSTTRVYGMLDYSERSVPQSVWSPVICCWPKPGSTSIWGLGLGDLCLHSRGRTMQLIAPTVVALNPQRFPPVSIPTQGILTALLPSTLDVPGLQTPLYPINPCSSSKWANTFQEQIHT